jgi:hypothetical protein
MISLYKPFTAHLMFSKREAQSANKSGRHMLNEFDLY